MGFSLDGYINSKKKEGQSSGGLSPSATLGVMPSATVGGGFSLDSYVNGKRKKETKETAPTFQSAIKPAMQVGAGKKTDSVAAPPKEAARTTVPAPASTQSKPDKMQPYAARRDTVTASTPYAAGPQAKQAAEMPKSAKTGADRPSFAQRAVDTVSGGLKGTAASMTNMVGTLREMGKAGRDKQNRELIDDYARELEYAQRALDAALEDVAKNPGAWSQGDIQSFYNARDDARRKYDAVAKVYGKENQEKTIRGVYEVADKVQESSAKDIERAKEGLGTIGGMLVDAGASMAQMAGDAIGGALTGNGMIPFAVRAFGGGTQQARQDGADLKGQVTYGAMSAAKEVLTEKMFNVALPFSRVYGGGSMDDAVERVIRKAVDKLATTEWGQKVLGSLLTLAASGVSEGLEEFIGDWMEWQMPRIYGGDVDSAQETLVNSLYDFAVGGMTGLAGGALSAGQYDIGDRGQMQATAQEGTQTAESGEDILAVAARQVAEQGRVTNSTTEAILAGEDAISVLEEHAGLTITEDMTQAQRRAAVKSAVEALTRGEGGLALEQSGTTPAVTQAIEEMAMPRQEAKRDTAIGRETALDTLSRSLDSFGKNGQKALMAGYEAGQDSGLYYAGFANYYDAGVAGTDMEKVESKYAGQLTEAQKYAAYTSGRNDAAASLLQERMAAQRAKVAGTEGGMDPDSYAYVADTFGEDEAKRIDASTRLLGARVGMVESLGKANGQINDDMILLSKDMTNPLMFTAGHEITHRVQTLAPDAYREFRDLNKDILAPRAERVLETYQKNGMTITYERALDEAAADYAGDLLNDGELLDEFIERNRENKTLLQRFWEALRNLIQKIKDKLTGQEKAQMETAEKKLSEALDAAAKQAKELSAKKETAASQQTGGEVRYSLKTVGGKAVVWIDKSPLTNKELNSHTAVAQYIAQHIGEVYTIIESGQKVYIGGDLPGEYTQSKYTSYLRKADGTAARAKNKAVSGLGEMIEIATNRRWEPTEHPETKDAKYGMYRYDSTFAFPVKGNDGSTVRVRAFDVELLIRNASDGKKYLYDIVNIKENTTAQIDLTEKEARLAAHKAASGGDVSMDSISQDGEKSNTKFSLKGVELEEAYADLEEENKMLRAQLERARGELKLTTEKTLRQEDVDKLARRLIKRYESGLKAGEISGDLKALGEYLIRGGDGTEELNYPAVRERALGVAQKLVRSALVKNDTLYREYSDLRTYLRTTKINVPRSLWGELETEGGYNEFRKRNMGRLNLSSADGISIDAAFQELADRYPAWFDEKVTSHPADQLIQMAEALAALQPVYENPYSGWMEIAVEQVANDVLKGIMSEDVRQSPPTVADKQAAKLEMERGKWRRALERAWEQRDQRVKQIQEHFAEVRKRQAERRMDSKDRNRLLNIAKRLKNRKLPEVSRALLDQYIGDLDTISRSLTKKSLKNLTELQSWYSNRKQSDPDFIADPRIEAELARLSQRHIDDLTIDEVLDLTEILCNIENELRVERKLIDSEDRRDTYMLGKDVIDDIYNTRGSKGGPIDKFIVTETLSPVRQVRRMIGYVDSDPLYQLTNALADGQRAMLDYQMRAEKPFQKYAEDKAFSRQFSGKDAEAIEITGMISTWNGVKTVKITPAMRVSLYLHSLNDQNLRHIKEGGITVPDEKLYRQGKIAEAYDRGVTIKLTPSQVREIAAGMTEKERAFALEVHRYFNSVSPKAINPVSEKLKGYSIARVKNTYYPIHTDASFSRAEFESIKFDGTIEGMGFLKERQNYAANPILLRDANDVVEQAIRMNGKYVGLAIPVRNFNKVWSVTTGRLIDLPDGTVEKSGYESSVQQTVKQKWGEAGYRYIEKMMKDVQGDTDQKNVWVKAMNEVRGNYAGAVLVLNLSVAMKQAASYPTAAAVLGWEPLAKAMKDFGKVDLDLIAKYTPLQWYRSKGFSTKELGDMKGANKQLPAVLNWVQGIDLITTRKLWKASEYYVQQHNKALVKGMDGYYKAVADIYNRVIEETQPNYTTMQRPQLLRSDDTLMGNLAMFKTQPFQNFNILYDAAGEFAAKSRRAKTGGEEAQAEAKQARKNFSRAVTSQLAQLAVFAGMTMAWAMFRGKTSKYEDEEGEMSLLSTLAALGKDMVGGALSGIPFGSDAWELLSSKMFGDTYYGMDVVTVTAITDTITSVSGMAEEIYGIVKSVATSEEINWNAARLKLSGYLEDISKAAGVPWENVANLFNAVYRQVCVKVMGKYRGEYAALKMTTDPDKYSADYYNLLYKAMQDDRESYEAIYGDMVDNWGFTEKKIKSAMEKRMKDTQGVKKASEMEQRYLSPIKTERYNDIRSKVSGSSVWRKASQEQRENVEDLLYEIAVGSSAGAKMEEKIRGGAAYGIGEADYLLYKLALSMADKPTESGEMGTYTNEEVEEAIDMLTGLSDQARSYLWKMQGKSDKSDPWG